jgi:hypothetical protein
MAGAREAVVAMLEQIGTNHARRVQGKSQRDW